MMHLKPLAAAILWHKLSITFFLGQLMSNIDLFCLKALSIFYHFLWMHFFFYNLFVGKTCSFVFTYSKWWFHLWLKRKHSDFQKELGSQTSTHSVLPWPSLDKLKAKLSISITNSRIVISDKICIFILRFKCSYKVLRNVKYNQDEQLPKF